MKYLSVCSGIEAATVAWHPLGWEPVAFSEIEKFPSQVLAHHYPDTPNWGDMTKFKEWQDADVDVFVGGTPCQSFSVAGLRKGLDDPRGNLMLTYLAIAAKYRPQWLVWENVPGVLSSNGGLDFASLLRGMGECGYGFAYRVLDAQYFGVAQRRRRVFVIGYLGDWRPAAAVLFERHSLSGHPAPSREKRENSSIHAGKGIAECSPTIGCELAKQVNNQMIGNAEAFFIPDTPAQPIATQPIPLDSMNIKERPSDERRGNRIGRGYGEEGDPMFTITRTDHHAVAHPIVLMDQGGSLMEVNTDGLVGTLRRETHGHEPIVMQPIAFAQNQRDEVRIMAQAGTLAAKPGMKQQTYIAQPIAYALDSLASNSMKSKNPASGCNEVDISKTLDTSRGLDPSCNQGGIAVAQPIAFSGQMSNPQTDVDMTQTLQAKNPMAVQQAMAVRRLTPVECERLQGFPDNYTDIKHKGKPTPDGPRYKALGNSMAVPVMHWIGQRIQKVQDILGEA